MKKLYKPETKKRLKELIKEHFDRGETDLNDIDTSLITSMSFLFENIDFNFDVSKWNTGEVIEMQFMFYRCSAFNQNLSSWNTENVEDMEGMFCECISFNQDISDWNVSNVKNMRKMFIECSSFNQDLSRWNIRKVTGMIDIFYDCPIKEEWKPKYLNLYGKTIQT